VIKMDRIAPTPSCGLGPHHHLHHRPGDEEVSVIDTLSDEELIEKMHQDLYDGRREEGGVSPKPRKFREASLADFPAETFDKWGQKMASSGRRSRPILG